VHLRGIHTLYMWNCWQPAITDAAFLQLRGIHTLVIDSCNQATITGATFVHLKGVLALGMYDCSDEQEASARSLGLPVNTRDCTECGGLYYLFDEEAVQED
jgi:hypothetical protein